jgi:DNA polymerase-3 subunit gamma/tau
MSYQVIARKYRPQRFGEVVGQEHVTRTLQNAIQQNRIAHAYLFVGPRGTGKTTIARIFAKCLNCIGGPKVDFPDDDPRSQEIAEGRSLDVLEIDGASNRGIEEIRELRETVKYAPATSRFKIYIIDEVHMLTKEAFNALLKTLEEPPAHVKFMFATTEPEKVIPTILSRCQRFDLRRIPIPLIVQHLLHIAQQENVRIDEAALHAIARGAEGGMRDAESALDQLISFCGDTIVENDVLSMFGLTARDQVLALARAILAGDSPTVLQELNSLTEQGKDLGRLLSDLLRHFRNLLIYRVTDGDLNLLEISESEETALKTQAPLADTEILTRIMEILTEAEGGYRDAASKKIFLEVALLKAIQARQTVPLESILKELQTLRGTTRAPVSAAAPRSDARRSAPRSTPARATESSPANKTTVPVNPIPPAISPAPPGLETLWTDLLESVGRASAFIRTYLLKAHPVSLDEGVFTVGFDPEFADQLELVNNQRTHALLQTKLHELGHPNVQIKFIQAEATHAQPKPAPASPPETTGRPKPTPPPTTQTAAVRPAPAEKRPLPEKTNPEEFKNDPLIQKALEVFKGRIVEVRA